MPSIADRPRRSGAPPGNRNRLSHGLYSKLALERRAATVRIVAAMHEISANFEAVARQRAALNGAGYSKRKNKKIDVQIALALFKYVSERLKSAAIPDDHPFEPVPAPLRRRRAGGVQSHSGEATAGAISPVEGL